MPLAELIPFPSDAPLPGEMYRHRKGHLCRVVSTGYHTETGEQVVVYTEMTTGQVFVRPLAQWGDHIDAGDGARVQRFSRVPPEAVPPTPMNYRTLAIKVGNIDKFDSSIQTLEEVIQRGTVLSHQRNTLADICGIIQALKRAAGEQERTRRILVEPPVHYHPAPTMMAALVAMRAPLRDLKQQRISEAEYHALPEDVKAFFTLVSADEAEVGMASGSRKSVLDGGLKPGEMGVVVNYPLDGIKTVSQEEYLKRHPERAHLFAEINKVQVQCQSSRWVWSKPYGDNDTVRGSTEDGWAATVHLSDAITRGWVVTVTFKHSPMVQAFGTRADAMAWAEKVRLDALKEHLDAGPKMESTFDKLRDSCGPTHLP